MFPQRIKVVDGKKLYIHWDDNVENLIELKKLREFCPCAFCNKRREQVNIIQIPIYNADATKVKSISLVGKYAINIVWEDGHKDGIYDFQWLRTIMPEYHHCHNNKEKID
ncbi:MAG TPA: DUF971 domain-containing protein [Ignavibacteriales bacterium]|nr:DUF971 domain-containing protein [Bacteroidales bacterium]HOJ37272.1 DUF971 domain-containing protein [Ignavibacteriales bacterium]HOL80386.1 DUF971 domain-containing protein [Ignavibacteriales bacterium]HOM64837.1 DUF971 domain-containing protein [Ignavibacteriales bacterium]HPD67430.1 DUF971 domain-containing protein [Ignavibacteriales bacterium]